MRGELVAIDLETTGLDVTTDHIIEVGIVRLKDGVVIDEYASMVNPGIQIPSQTTYITSIQQEDVEGAPGINAVLPEISDFIGDAPMIAHNISLDMGFLQQRHGIVKANKGIDTYDLATILLPGAPRYNLNSLTMQVGIELENAHRALDDARAAGLLYWELWKRLLKLPHTILQEISAAGSSVQWSTGIVFTAALQQSNTSSRDIVPDDLQGFISAPETYDELSPAGKKTAPSTQSVAHYLEEDEGFAEKLDAYERRPQQVKMAEKITEAFTKSKSVMIEADTGTGKSLAYLLPAVLWAIDHGERVVVSTQTINLQDQLIHQDLPTLQKALDLDFRYTVMKGRDHYLCPRQLTAMRRRKPNNPDEVRTLAKILVWLTQSQTGDRGEINLRSPAERAIWQRLSASADNCTVNRCENTMQGICPFYKARKAATSAHLIIVNHALLIADAKSDRQVIPDYNYVIIDEAHQLEDAVTHSLTFRIDEQSLQRRLVALGTPQQGLFGETLKNIAAHASQKEHQRLVNFVTTVTDALKLMGVHITNIFKAIHTFVQEIKQNRPTEYLTLLRIDNKLRNRGSFAQIQAHWRTLDEFFEVIGKALAKLTKALRKISDNRVDLQNLIDSANTAANYFAETRQSLHETFMEPNNNTIHWISQSQGSTQPFVQSAPLHVGPMIDQYLWQNKRTVVLTSATLQTHESFEFIKERLYAEAIDTVEIPPVFNYEESTLIYLPDDIPEPNQRQSYQKAVERGIIALAAALEGRVMVLFTSYSQLRQTSQAITPRLMLGKIEVYDQSDGTSRETLLEGFKSSEKAVLMGTKSFWEGIDIPGESLSALIIVRLPFAVPSDPIFASRSESYSNSFNEYAVPDAILRFRQGFGRLIRSTSDRGVFTVFDRRVLSKKYGSSFLESLPNAKVQTGSLDELPAVARKWLKLNE